MKRFLNPLFIAIIIAVIGIFMNASYAEDMGFSDGSNKSGVHRGAGVRGVVTDGWMDGPGLDPGENSGVLEVTYDGSTKYFYAAADSDITQYHPDSNRALYGYMNTRNYSGASTNNWECNALVKFDISSIPLDATITEASLNLYYYDYYDNNPAGNNIDVHRITQDWSETTVTWNNKPLSSGVATDSQTVPASTGAWMKWDVTEDVRADISDRVHYGWLLRDTTVYGSSNIPIAMFRTKDHMISGFDLNTWNERTVQSIEAVNDSTIKVLFTNGDMYFTSNPYYSDISYLAMKSGFNFYLYIDAAGHCKGIVLVKWP